MEPGKIFSPASFAYGFKDLIEGCPCGWTHPLGTKTAYKKMDKALEKTLAKKEIFLKKRLAFPRLVWYYN